MMRGRIRHPELLIKFWTDNPFEVEIQYPAGPFFLFHPIRKGIIMVDIKGNFAYEGPSSQVQSYLSKFAAWAAKQACSTIENEKEKKGTSEVAPTTSMTSNEIHGGDGVAGEVPDSPNKGGKPDDENIVNGSQSQSISDFIESSEITGSPRNGGESPASESEKADDDSQNKGSDSPSSGQGSGSHVPDQTGHTDAFAGSPAVDAMNAEEKTSSFGAEEENTLADSGEAGSNAPEFDESGPESSRGMSAGGTDEKDVPALSEKERSNLFKGAMKGFSQSNPSCKSNPTFGGRNDSLKDIKINKQLVLQARRVFSKMIHGGEGDAGARYSAKKYSTKIAGYLRAPSVDDRRLEDGRPALLVMADTSGSMSRFSNEVLAVGMSVKNMGGIGGDIILINQSNGYPIEVMVGNKIDSWGYYDSESRGTDRIIEYYLKLIQQHNIKAVVVAADWDGAWLYRALSKVVDVYWVDVYCSSYGDVRVQNVHDREDFSLFNKQRVHYADRCGTAKNMLDALSKMLRRN